MKLSGDAPLPVQHQVAEIPLAKQFMDFSHRKQGVVQPTQLDHEHGSWQKPQNSPKKQTRSTLSVFAGFVKSSPAFVHY